MLRRTTTAIALVLGTALATGALAYSDQTDAFGYQDRQQPGWSVTMNLVRSANGGTVEIRDLDGTVLGRTSVNAGANDEVKVRLDARANRDVVAYLLDNSGNTVDQQLIDVATID